MARPFFRRRSYFPWWLELIGVGIARLFYRVRTSGTEHMPSTGGVLLVTNHQSYVDAIVLQLASPRPLRFIAYEGLNRSWFYQLVFRWSGLIAISSQNPIEAVRRAVKALEAGDVVCIFPEGNISRTGQLQEIKKGFELMARRAGVPVVPAAHDGLWGSIFSFSGNKYIWKAPRLLPTPVFVAFGPIIPPPQADAPTVRRALLDLGEIAFAQRPLLRRHLAREIVRSLAKRPWHVVVVDRTAARRALTSAQLLAVTAVLARRLRATIPELRVGIVLPPGAGGFIANLAVLCAGKIPVNLNFTAGRSSLESSMKVAGVATILSADVMRTKLPAFPWPERTLDLGKEIAAGGGKRAMLPWVIAAWVLPNQIFANRLHLPKTGDRTEASLLFTSGSSGEPKGVVLTHRNILANCTQISALSILPKSSTMLGCLPLFHSFGFTVTLWYPLLRGCQLVTVPSPLDTRKMLDAIREEGVSVLIAAPMFMWAILKKARPGELKGLDLVVTGAEKLPDDLYRSFLETFHIEVLQGYGLTECSPVSNVNQHHPPIVTETGEFQVGKKHGSVGRLMPGMTARIVDPETSAELAFTATGMLWLRGANIFPGYLGDEERSRQALRDGWFVTGDLARFDDDGFLFIEGRLSRFSKIAGEMVPHVTVEQKIIDLFGWSQDEGPVITLVGVPDAMKGESLVLLATVEVSVEELRERLGSAGVPNLWVPRVVLRVERIPMLGSGKTDLRHARELALAGGAPAP